MAESILNPASIPAQVIDQVADLADLDGGDELLEVAMENLIRASVDSAFSLESLRIQEDWRDLEDAARSIEESANHIRSIAARIRHAIGRMEREQGIARAPRFGTWSASLAGQSPRSLSFSGGTARYSNGSIV